MFFFFEMAQLDSMAMVYSQGGLSAVILTDEKVVSPFVLSRSWTLPQKPYQSVDFSGYVLTPPAVYPITTAWTLLHQTS